MICLIPGISEHTHIHLKIEYGKEKRFEIWDFLWKTFQLLLMLREWIFKRPFINIGKFPIKNTVASFQIVPEFVLYFTKWSEGVNLYQQNYKTTKFFRLLRNYDENALFHHFK